MPISTLLAFACAFLLAVAIVRLLASDRLARLVLDIPNERSLHDRPIPRTGGIGLMLAAALVWVGLGQGALTPVALLAGALAALFFVDDVRGLSVAVRVGAQLAAAVAFVLFTGPYPLALLLAPMLVVGIVWSTNLYNFMDGANGMAGGMAVFGFGTYTIAATMAGANDLAIVSAIVTGAAAGFLVWNFDLARIFLGDAGSIPLGFLAAAIGVLGWSRGLWPFWLPLLAFSPFVVDACVTLIYRARRGEKLSQAHKSHYYQRLVRMGWSHRRLALAEYAAMAAAGTTALLMRNAGPLLVALLLGVWTLVYGALAIAIDRRWCAAGGGV
jgi:UDP-N-acetylmuramyl pentapeptide phosphotransferase/UDP-N-acetylglucosamine-1-phosphate transferase